MRNRALTLALTLVLASGVTACGRERAEGSTPRVGTPGEPMADQGPAASSFVEREFWLALAEEPGWHLNVARELFLKGQNQKASQELAKVAAILNFESRHSHSSREEGLLLASVQELREVSRQLRYQEGSDSGPTSLVEMDRVAALAFRTLAAHQVTLARDALEAGDARMAGLYVLETAKALEAGFQRGGIEMGNVLPSEMERAREVASRLEMEGDGSRDEGLAILGVLGTAVEELGNVLTGGRK